MFDIGKRGSGSQKDEQEGEIDSLRNTTPDTGTIPRGESADTGVRRRDAAVIGPSIHIEGTLRGEEDLIIEGQVKGTVQLQGHTLTVGGKGQVEAELHAQSIYVDGTVQGDLHGTELVCIRKSARIFGNVTAPRVSLEDGAKFKGAIDMDVEATRSTASAPTTGKAATSGQSAAERPASGSADSGKTGDRKAGDSPGSASSGGAGGSRGSAAG